MATMGLSQMVIAGCILSTWCFALALRWGIHWWGRYQQCPHYGQNITSSRLGSWHMSAPGEVQSLFDQFFPAPSEPSLLLQYKESGLSSSSYELSQYMFDSSDQYDPASSQTWSPIQSEIAPQKYPHPHVPVCFGAGGQLVRVCPNSPAEGQPALVEMHSLEIILSDTTEQEEMQAFPGPLVREDLHKVDVMTFCQRRVALSEVETQRGRDSALLWKLLLLLCRQNGAMVGSDTAELLMQDCKRRERYHRQETVANLINLTDESWPVPGGGMPDLLTGEIPPCTETPQHSVEKFTKLLFYGRKKEALDRAMRSQLWGHALFLSSKMDLRTYSWVLSGFTSTLALNDPLQTLFQLMSGRIPQAALCCGDERWGDWRPHLDVILSNQIGDAELNHRAIIAMGDTLAGKGLIEAAHFCYLMANVTLGCYRVRTDRVVLLGSSQDQTFAQFARTDCIQRTEVFEYCQLLGHPKAFIPAFQMYKLLYASRLADYGLPSQALHYCEGIGITLLAQGQSSYPVLLEQVIKVGLGTSSGLFWLWLGSKQCHSGPKVDVALCVVTHTPTAQRGSPKVAGMSGWGQGTRCRMTHTRSPQCDDSSHWSDQSRAALMRTASQGWWEHTLAASGESPATPSLSPPPAKESRSPPAGMRTRTMLFQTKQINI
uniref:Protein transport protein sec16 n=1 Tax=Sphenodon punctatus TaxID=8508 RepID=A0A8D0H2Q2_SPHPU